MPLLLSLHDGKKLSILEAFVFTVGKKLQQMTLKLNAPAEHHENGFVITSGNSLRMMNLLIQWITWYYALRHHLLKWWKTSEAIAGLKTTRSFLKSCWKIFRTETLIWVLRFIFLQNHLDKFPDNCDYVNAEHREWFHHDIKPLEESYQGLWNKRMMADYCWSMKRNLYNIEHDW